MIKINIKNDGNPVTSGLLLGQYSARASQWIPTWQGLDGFQISLRHCDLDERSLSIERVKLIDNF